MRYKHVEKRNNLGRKISTSLSILARLHNIAWDK